jgi:hypothetical protein
MSLPSRQHLRHLRAFNILYTTTTNDQTTTKSRPKTKPQVSKNICSFQQSKIDNGHEIALCGDLNEELGSTAGGMSQVTTNLGLIDIHAQTQGLDSEVAMYARGTKRLNYILMTEQLASHSTNCGARPFSHRF